MNTCLRNLQNLRKPSSPGQRKSIVTPPEGRIIPPTGGFERGLDFFISHKIKHLTAARPACHMALG